MNTKLASDYLPDKPFNPRLADGLDSELRAANLMLRDFLSENSRFRPGLAGGALGRLDRSLLTARRKIAELRREKRMRLSTSEKAAINKNLARYRVGGGS